MGGGLQRRVGFLSILVHGTCKKCASDNYRIRPSGITHRKPTWHGTAYGAPCLSDCLWED